MLLMRRQEQVQQRFALSPGLYRNVCARIVAIKMGRSAVNDALLRTHADDICGTLKSPRPPHISVPLDEGPKPLLLSARQAGAMCGKSLRTWRTWDAAGWIPRPVRIGRSTLWRTDELREWIGAGCPRRAEWEARK
jgi:predicted DNA-binding transcriptional regulator AlpA